MEEPYGEGVASHTGPESCAGGREGTGEALTGEHVGWVLSSEITHSVCRPYPDKGKAT
jgi:RNA-directed DNA polymerase